jgi:hypothetical protein
MKFVHWDHDKAPCEISAPVMRPSLEEPWPLTTRDAEGRSQVRVTSSVFLATVDQGADQRFWLEERFEAE